MRKKSKPINTKTPTILYRDNNEYLAIMWIYGVAHGDEGIEYANGSTKEEVRISLVQNADDELKRIYSKYGPNTPIQVAGDMQDTMTRTDIDNKGSTCTRYKMMDNGILKWAIQRSRLKSFGFDHREEGSKYITRRSRKEGGGARGIDHLLVCDLFASFQTWPIMWAKSFAFCMTCLFEKLLRKNLRKTSLTRGSRTRRERTGHVIALPLAKANSKQQPARTGHVIALPPSRQSKQQTAARHRNEISFGPKSHKLAYTFRLATYFQRTAYTYATMRSPVPFVTSTKAASSWMVVPRGGGVVDSLFGGPAVVVEPVKESLISSFGAPIAFALSVALAAVALTMCLLVAQNFPFKSAFGATIVDETGKPTKAGPVKTVATAITAVAGFVLGMNV